MANNKVQLSNGSVLMDITDTTATASDVAQGKYFYTSAGVKTEGTSSGGSAVEPVCELGGYYSSSAFVVNILRNHVKIQLTGTSTSSLTAGLRQIAASVSQLPLWFTIPSGSTVVITYKNVVNASDLTWNCNFRDTSNSVVSPSLAIGDATHLSGETATQTFSSSVDVGNYYIYIKKRSQGAVLEFDVELTIDGVRYL